MARVRVPLTVQTMLGNAVVGASVAITKVSDGATATLYSSRTGGGTASNPTLTDATGRTDVFIAEGSYIAAISAPGLAYSEPFEAVSGNTAARLPLDVLDVRDYGAIVNGGDNTSTIQAALNAAGALPYGSPVFIPAGGHHISATLTVPQGASIVAPPLLNGAAAALYHNFNGPLIVLAEGSDLENLYLIQNGAYSGAAIQHVTPNSTSRGFFTFRRIVVTDFVGDRGWERDVYIDGSLGSLGVRSLFFDDCQFFGASTPGETVALYKPVHCFFKACEVIQSPQTSVVCGVRVYNAFSEDVHFSGCSVDGNFYTEAAQLSYQGRIRQGRTITCAAGSNHNLFYGDVGRATFVNNGGSGNGRVMAPLKASVTWDPPMVAAGATTTTTVTVTGAVYGNPVAVGFSNPNAGLLLFAQVTAPDTVTVTAWNTSTLPIDMVSGILNVEVGRP